MYFEIENLTMQERDILQDMFCNRLRPIHSIYTELGRIEAECSLESNGVNKPSEELIEEVAFEILHRSENTIFQDLSDVADEVVANVLSKGDVL